MQKHVMMWDNRSKKGIPTWQTDHKHKCNSGFDVYFPYNLFTSMLIPCFSQGFCSKPPAPPPLPKKVNANAYKRAEKHNRGNSELILLICVPSVLRAREQALRRNSVFKLCYLHHSCIHLHIGNETSIHSTI